MDPKLSSDSENVTFWNFPGQSRKVYYFDVLGSTMDAACELARKNCAGGTVVVAGRQKKGRGRMAREWHSEEGGLYFTIILRPDLQLDRSARIGFAASLAMTHTLKQLFGVVAKVKWPNDLLVQDRKIAGMLSQVEAESDRIVFLNIGIGLNVNNNPKKIAPESTSLLSLLKRKVSRRKILFDFVSRLDARMCDDIAMARIIDDWKAHTITLGRRVKVVTSQGAYQGVARDVDSSGALILESDDGILRPVLYGDCFHQ